MAKFTFAAIDGAARCLAKFDGVDAHVWAAMDEDDRNDYRRNAEKILNAAKDAVRQLSK